VAELLPVLARLDRQLDAAMRRAAAHDPQRGPEIEVAVEGSWLFQQTATAARFGINGHPVDDDAAVHLPATARLIWLRDRYDLTIFDLDVLLLALAPELDRRYEQTYAYLQNHVSRGWPTVDLALQLFSADAAQRLQDRRRFDPTAPLLAHGLLHLGAEPEPAGASLLTHTLRLDEQIVRFLLHQDGPDARLTPFCHLLAPVMAEPALLHPQQASLTALALAATQAAQPLWLYFQGADRERQRATANALAADLGARVLLVDLPQALARKVDLAALLPHLWRYAALYQVVLLFEGMDELAAGDAGVYRLLLTTEAPGGSVTILCGTEPWRSEPHMAATVFSLPFPKLDFTERQAHWQHALAQLGVAVPPTTLATLGDRFQLTTGQIRAAAQLAQRQAQWQGAARAEGTFALTQSDLFQAARAQTGHHLATLARSITPRYAWADLVLPADVLAQLHEIAQRVAYRQQVLDGWGFERKLASGTGIAALFAGPSGAGKTMAAEVIAHEVGLDLYQIDLASVVSKYIGETEKNLSRIFAAAEDANAILFFDEADALFGKRSEVSDAHDRYANIEISYLLQKMEEYAGITILATNLRQNLDEAFLRRLAFAVHFPFPDAESRRRIWAGVWPPQTPLAADVDCARLAERCKLSGGNIKNVALAAAFLAAADTGPVTMHHLRQAIRREYQKLGKVLDEREWMVDDGKLARG
jgi:hypothetical protein